MSDKTVLLGVTGSIAAYKAAELVRLMKKEAWSVSVIMTQSATRFIGEMTFRTLSGNPVVVDMFEKGDEWCPEHISLADSADAMIVAPCTANVLAKLALGLADDSLTAAALACKAPLIIAPAMNSNMLSNPATQSNLDILASRGAVIIEPETGDLACGYSGKGRMPEPTKIIQEIHRVFRG